MQIEIQRGFGNRNIMCFLFWVIYGGHDDTWTCQPSIYGNATRAEIANSDQIWWQHVAT
jgi:hypothetical protein